MVVPDTTKIRAHHLLCMQAFQGYGYSQDFVTNMAQVVKDINSSPDLKIEIIAECDVICSRCPYNYEGLCKKNPDSAMELKSLDTYILKKLGLRNGAKVKAKNIFSLVKTKLEDSDIEYICGDCQWKETCLEVT